jgi:hypothetical protein
VTVCTNDVALDHLVEDALPVPVAKALANPEFLVAKMVELEDKEDRSRRSRRRDGLENS